MSCETEPYEAADVESFLSFIPGNFIQFNQKELEKPLKCLRIRKNVYKIFIMFVYMFIVCLWWKGFRSILFLVTKGTKHHYCIVEIGQTS